MKMQFEKSKLGLTAVTIIGGIIVSMLSGFFENAAKGSMIAAFVFLSNYLLSLLKSNLLKNAGAY
jgi:hypothetical protein